MWTIIAERPDSRTHTFLSIKGDREEAIAQWRSCEPDATFVASVPGSTGAALMPFINVMGACGWSEDEATGTVHHSRLNVRHECWEHALVDCIQVGSDA